MKVLTIIKDGSTVEANEIATLSNGDKVVMIDGFVGVAEKVEKGYEYVLDTIDFSELIQSIESIISIMNAVSFLNIGSPWKIMQEGKKKEAKLKRLEDLLRNPGN